MGAGTSLTDIAVELCTGPLSEFVSARNALARKTSDPGLATQIRGLKKPSVAAWVVNVFARERVSELADALRLAQELREAQDDLDAKTLAQLGRDRRALTNRLAEDAARLAKSRGESVSPATLDAVRQTLGAAFFDPEAAAAVASGRLLRELEPGSPLENSGDVVAGGAVGPLETARVPVDEVAARRELRAAQRSLRDKQQTHHRSQKEAAEADRELRDATVQVVGLARRLRDLETEIADVRREAHAARSSAEAAEERQARAARAAADAAEAVEDAQSALRDLESPQ